MEYSINTACFASVFTIPTAVVDNHLSFAKAEHIKILLYIFRNVGSKIDEKTIASQLKMDEYDVSEGLLFWADAGILLPENKAYAKAEAKKPKAVAKAKKPSRSDVTKIAMNDTKIQYLLQETQLKMGRIIKDNEANTLVWLYQDLGLDVSLILMIIQYAVAHNKANIRFIEQTAVDWINKGIDNIADAEKELSVLTKGDLAWRVVSSAFGIEKRKPSKKEIEYSLLWLDEWKISKELLCEAYEKCVDTKSRFYFPYVAKIIEEWHKKGITTPEQALQEGTKSNNNDYGAYDIDLFEKMLNSKD